MTRALFLEPLKIRDEDERWYVVIMEGGDHFYFDRTTGHSSWQLSDIEGGNEAVVDFDKIAMYLAMARGLKWGVQEPKGTADLKLKSDENILKEDLGDIDIQEDTSESNSDAEFNDTEDSNNQLVMDLLRLEGYIDSLPEPEQESESESESELILNQNQGAPSGLALVEGYSSSEEETEDNSQDEESKQQSGLDNTNDYSEDDGQNGTKSFMALLDEFSDQIDVFSTWQMVENVLLPKWMTRPEYYGISEPHEKEALFYQWVKSKAKTKTTTCDTNVENGIAVTSTTITTPSTQYDLPTPRMEYLQFLLHHKKDVKRLTYHEFLNRHGHEWELAISEQKSTYLEYKLVLENQEVFERLEKGKYLNQNMKSLALGRWLARQKIPRQKLALPFAEDTWIALVRSLQLPRDLVENPINYIVGDEKRVQCYLAVVSDDNDSGK